MVPSESLRAEFQPFYAGPPLHWQRYGIVVVNIAALAYGRTTSRKKVLIMASRVLGRCLLHRVFIHPAFDDQSVARHGTGDGKKRVALQKETTRTVARLNPNTIKPRTDNPQRYHRTSKPARAICFDDEVESTSGLRVPLLLLRDQSPS